MREQHEALLQEWREREHHRGRRFIADGAIDPTKWASATRKVLFLLKEAYDERDGCEGWDLCELVRDEWKGPKHKIWQLVAKCCYGIKHATPGGFASLTEVEGDAEGQKEALFSAAIVNVKKSGGTSRSNMADIRSFFQKDQDLLRRQIDLLAPQIVVCGYTWDIVRDLWNGVVKVPDRDLVYRTPAGGFVVDFWHPANHYPNHLNYHGLLSVLDQAGALR